MKGLIVLPAVIGAFAAVAIVVVAIARFAYKIGKDNPDEPHDETTRAS